MAEKDSIQVTNKYFDSQEADEYHQLIWGGEYTHVGIHADQETGIEQASENTIKAMVKKLPSIKKSTRILDIGSGYGGTARYLSKKFGCRVDCLNLSETENERNREKTRESGLEDLVQVISGSFENIPLEGPYDIVWSQDAIFYSSRKDKVLREVNRVLNPGGRFIFTDLMRNDDSPVGVLENVLTELHLQELGSIKVYEKLTRQAGLQRVLVVSMPEQLINHYTAVLEKLARQRPGLIKKSSETYVDDVARGLQYWIDAGKEGYLNWGILQFQKPNL